MSEIIDAVGGKLKRRVNDLYDYRGRFNLFNSGNFDTYMAALGLSKEIRSLGNNINFTYDIRIDGSDWTFKTITAYKTTELSFRLGEEFDETTLDGRRVKTTFTFDDGKLVQRQRATKVGEKDSDLIRELISNDDMHVTLIVHEPDGSKVTTHRFYRRRNH